MVKGFLLAAGFGTRLKPLTDHVAKPSLPVLGIPAFWFNAWHMSKSFGLKEMAMNVGHCANSLKDAVSDQDLLKFTGLDFHLSDESSKVLGSSGGLWKIKDWAGECELAVQNADSISNVNWKKLLEFHHSKKAKMTLHLRPFFVSPGSEKYSTWSVDSDGRIQSMDHKAESGTMFAGSYILDSKALDMLPEGKSETKETLFEPLIKQRKLFAYQEETKWFDTGSIQSFAETQFKLLSGIPMFKELVEVKMKEVSPNIWLPKDWKKTTLKLNQPVVFSGEQSKWESIAKEYGPNFVGVNPSDSKIEQTKDAVVFLEHVCGLQ